MRRSTRRSSTLCRTPAVCWLALVLSSIVIWPTAARPLSSRSPSGETLLSEGKPASASSFDSGSEQYAPPGHANDGSLTSYWYSDYGAEFPHWWQVDLGTRASISRVDAAWYNFGGELAFDYEIAVSDDSATFATVFTGTTPIPPAYYYDPIDTSTTLPSPAQGRYVRITITGSSGYPYGVWTAIGVHEFRVYGSAAATPPTPTATPIPPTPTPTPAPTPPPSTMSYYILDAVPAKAYDAGCALGRRDRDLPGTQDNFVILDFGRPAALKTTAGLVYGTILFNDQFAAPAQIMEATTEFGRGYWKCTGKDASSKVTIALGTNNKAPLDGRTTMAEHGAAWARIVNETQAVIGRKPYRKQVRAVGASDMELGYNTPAATRAWVNGYDSANNWPLYNFGDAEGCPATGDGSINQTCQSTVSGWTQEDVLSISWRGPVHPIPQIYATSGVNARQWYQIALYSSVSYQKTMYFDGVLTQYGACEDKTKEKGAKPSQCIDADQPPEAAWTSLWTTLNSDPRTAQPIQWATDIRWNISKRYP